MRHQTWGTSESSYRGKRSRETMYVMPKRIDPGLKNRIVQTDILMPIVPEASREDCCSCDYLDRCREVGYAASVRGVTATRGADASPVPCTLAATTST